MRGRRQISVEIRGGGVGLIRVTDNGSGIPSDEVALAFERHATSKISRPTDLQNIDSLGFRGEALPSIAAVSQVEMVTCADGETSGTFISLEGGAVTQKKSQSRSSGHHGHGEEPVPPGAGQVKVLEVGAHREQPCRQRGQPVRPGLPRGSFQSVGRRQGKSAARPGRASCSTAIIDVYGVEMAGKMLPVAGQDESWQGGPGRHRISNVSGMVGSPELGRAGRGYLSFFVNRRWVSSRLLSYAVEEAYQGLLMTGKHPVAVLDISLPPQDIDVNIHPAKSEVKFRNESEVFRAVQRAVRQALVAQMPVPRIEEVAAPYQAPARGGATLDALRKVQRRPAPPDEVAPTLTASLPVLRVVGQVMNGYIVAEGPDGLYLIDQHAAHERVRFDKVKQQRAQRRPEVQGLLEPSTFEVTPRQDEILKSCYAELADFGFSLEPFGERTYLVRAVPAMVAGDDWPGMLRELLDALSGEVKSRWEEKIIASIACHGAVKSGQTLSDDEMRGLVRQLEQTANPHTCPHGRPTVIRLSTAQLEREFGRS